MADKAGSFAISALAVQTALAEDKSSVALQFVSDGNVIWAAATDTESVEALIQTLGEARSRMSKPVADNLPEGVHPLSAFNPCWYATPDTENRFVTFWIRHPGFGWSGYGFPRHEAVKIAKWLIRIPAIITTQEKLKSLPPSATSFGNDSFLITTTGLGFYYYGKGERQIGPNPFEQVEYDSDRAAGIVAGSIAEQRLEEALKSRMSTDHPEISKNLFRPSAALGPFSTKIDIAYLMTILSDEAYKDLSTLKNIRNDFAHDLELDSFNAQSITDRCKAFILVDKHVGPVPEEFLNESADNSATGVSPFLGLPDYKEKLADPRFRYMMTAQIISFSLGQGSERPNQTLPLI